MPADPPLYPVHSNPLPTPTKSGKDFCPPIMKMYSRTWPPGRSFPFCRRRSSIFTSVTILF
ncbi:hypothetical protein LINGRAHAP2_LOCUS10887 [Linum grandiflorum]